MKAFGHQTKRAICILATLILPVPGWANPKGGDVKAGAASFENGSNTLTIRQSSDRGIIHWDEFSIRQGEITKFLQPNANSATLNRVVGTSASSLLGTLQSNGKVYLINPNGILIGPGARIDTGSFVASTLDVADSEFMAGGDMKFFGPSTAAVTNLGSIQASSGDVFLLGREVLNAGTISAPNGVVGLGAGSEILLKAAGDERLFVSPGGAGRATNSGVIAAAQAELKANGGNPYGLAVNNTGTIRATGAVTKNGRILLTANGGAVKNSGTLIARQATGAGGYVKLDGGHTGKAVNAGSIDASGKTGGQKGGRVEVLGGEVEIASTSLIDVSGDSGGGVALIGGDEHGANPTIANSEKVTVAAGSVVNADAISKGEGGKVVVWADGTTQYAGAISARGGALAGNGGFSEVSGKLQLAYTGSADLTAAHGATGQLLLDPTSINIESSDTATPNTPSTTAGGTTTFQDTTNTTSEILNTTLQNALNSANVVITTSSGAAGVGRITFDAPVTSTSTNKLTLNADASVIFNASVQIGGDLVITAGAAVMSNSSSTVQANTIKLQSVGTFVNFAGPITTEKLAIQANNAFTSDISIENPNNLIAELNNIASGGGFIHIVDGNAGLLINGFINGGMTTTGGEVTIQALGNITLAPGAQIFTNFGNNLTLVATATSPGVDGYFINNAGAGALQSSGRYLVYSENNVPPFKPGGLETTSSQYTSASVTYPSDPLGAGNVFYFAHLGGTSPGGGGGGGPSGSTTTDNSAPPPANQSTSVNPGLTDAQIQFAAQLALDAQTASQVTQGAYGAGGSFLQTSTITANGTWVGDIVNYIGGLASSIWSRLSNSAKLAINAVSSVLNSIGNAAKGAIAGFINAATSQSKNWATIPATNYNQTPPGTWIAQGSNVQFVDSNGTVHTAPPGGGIVAGPNGSVFLADAQGNPVPIGHHTVGGLFGIGGHSVPDYYMSNFQGAIAVSGNVSLTVPPTGSIAVGGGTVISGNGSIISHDGGGIISHDGGGIISHDGGGIISHDGGGIISHDGGGFISLHQ